MRHVPTLITLLRIALSPALAYCLLVGSYGVAAPVFMLAAVSDFADGYLARKFAVSSKLGAVLDPIADKLTMLVATLILAWQALLPTWLAAAIVGRDVLIVIGVLIYRLAIGRLEIAPTLLSKLNTLLEFAMLLLVLAIAAEWIDRGSWLAFLFVVVGGSVLASGAQYAWIWVSKAIAQLHQG